MDATIYKRLWLKMLGQRGRIKTGIDTSYEQRFPVKYKRGQSKSLAFNESIQFSPQDLYKWCTQDWKTWQESDVMHLIEYEQIAKSEKTLVNRYKRIIPNLIEDLKDDIGMMIYSDSSSTPNEFDGLETACGEGTCAAGDIIAQPSGTYLGQSTTLGACGGTWSTDQSTKPNSTVATDWPEGHGSAEYPWHAPKLLNYSSTGWGTGKTTWESNCQRAIRRSALWHRNTYGGEGTGKSAMLMLGTDLMAGFKNSLSASKMTLTPHKEAEELGFLDVLNYEGVGVYTEYGTPSGIGYMVDMDDLQLIFVTENMIKAKGPFEVPEGDYKWYAFFMGNIRFDPRRLTKFAAYA